MGFFSWKCRACGHSILASCAVDREINGWMNKAVAINYDGDMVIGSYDGYGEVDGTDVDGRAMWHKSCWEVAGRPGFDRPSAAAEDQGYFFDTEHDMLDPKVTASMTAEAAADLLARLVAKRDGARRGHAFFDKDQDADKGTYKELYRLSVLIPAASLTPVERLDRWGYDPIELHEKYGD